MDSKVIINTKFNQDIIEQEINIFGNVHREIINLRDKAVVQTLINLGWKPPNPKCPVLKMNEENWKRMAEHFGAGFTYVDIVTDGCEGWINLFFNGHCIAMVNNKELASQIKQHIDDQ